ncbi:carbohydrate ABC transporter permease [Cohnella endophytica]|uniref:carbohydrate ABC transporter permease n=1 Tax=Cohnella endophytica TaxID=2419778 RepID=UPI001F23B64B|nr:carbohydrate ABC transporter permease [Cohnella endophytica]
MKLIRRAIAYAVLWLLAAAFATPFIYTLYNSFMPLKYANKLVGMKEWTLEHYATFFTNEAYNVPLWFWNTLVMTGIIMLGNWIVNPMAAYALAKLNFRGKKLVLWMVMATMMVPYHMILIPVYVNMAQIGWLNTFAGLTVPFLYQCLYIFMLRQFYLGIPNELIEASRIDGLNKIGGFWRIVFPLAKSSLITMSILTFAGTWNSYLVPSTFVSSPEKYVLVVGLNSLKDAAFEKTSLIMAGVVLSTVPILLFFFFFQKQYIEGVSTSGIKG